MRQTVTPDNTFAPLSDNLARLTDEQEARIRRIARLLPLLEGSIELPDLEGTGREWLEKVRLKALENFDAVLARQRMRVCVTAQRITCCMMLCSMLENLIDRKGSVENAEDYLKRNPTAWKELLAKEQTDAMKSNYELIADTLLDTNMYYFKKQIRFANEEAEEYVGRVVGNAHALPSQSVFDLLEQEFTNAEAGVAYFKVRGKTASASGIANMIQVWVKRDMVTRKDYGVYMKC